MPLLWVLRDELNITGPKYGCGIAQCGACTVHVDGFCRAVLPGWRIGGCCMALKSQRLKALAHRTTLHAVQEAWIEHQVAQCGYCQSGQIMQAADLACSSIRRRSDDDIDAVPWVRQSVPVRHLSAYPGRRSTQPPARSCREA